MEQIKRKYQIYLDDAGETLINVLKSAQRANKLFYNTELLTNSDEEVSIEVSMRLDTMLNDIIMSNNKILSLDEEDLIILDIALNLYRIKLFHSYSNNINPVILLCLYRVHLEIRYHLMNPKFKTLISS
ncbi:MAG: hypothetical protein ACTSPY_14980 [Candidatus Helarchaeota archaeon]